MKPPTDAMIEYIQAKELEEYELSMCPDSNYFQWKVDNKHLSDFLCYKFSYPPTD